MLGVGLPLLLSNGGGAFLRRQHCSSLCSQSEDHEHVANTANIMGYVLVEFSVCAWPPQCSPPSLCEQSELQCFASLPTLIFWIINVLPVSVNILYQSPALISPSSEKAECTATRAKNKTY